MQMPSSPTSTVHPVTSARWLLHMSIPSPFCAFQGQRTVTPLIIRSVHWLGTRWKRGAFWMVTPLMSTRWQRLMLTMCWRRASSLSGASVMLRTFLRSYGNHSLPSSVSVPPSFWRSFHSWSLSLVRLAYRQYLPLPSMMPPPVMLTSVHFSARMQGSRRLSKPLSGRYADFSWVKMTIAPFSTCRSILLLSLMGPVSQTPFGTITWPPSGRALMALSNASVHIVTPSPTAPNCSMLTLASGICGSAGCSSSIGRFS